MSTEIGTVLHHQMTGRLIAGAFSGLAAAMAVDFQAFRSWKTGKEFTTYAWKVAFGRWLIGAISGAMGAAGFGAVA